MPVHLSVEPATRLGTVRPATWRAPAGRPLAALRRPRAARNVVALATLALALAAPASSSASGPALTGADMLGILFFLIDCALGPISGVLVAIALWNRKGGAGWRRAMTVVAILNLLVSGPLLYLSEGGLGVLVGLVWLQLAVAVALLVAALHPSIPLWKGGAGPVSAQP